MALDLRTILITIDIVYAARDTSQRKLILRNASLRPLLYVSKDR